MKKLLSLGEQTKIAQQMLFEEPELIEGYFQKNLLFNEPINRCFEAINWLDTVGDRKKGFGNDHSLQYLRPSNDGSVIYGVFEKNGKWYKSSFKTGRLFFRYWKTDIGCLAIVPEEKISNLLEETEAKSYMNCEAQFNPLFKNDYYHNNAFFSWKGSKFCGCIRHRENNMTENLIDSEFRINKSKEDFFEFIRPYVIKPE